MSALLHIWPMLAGAGVANALYRPKTKTGRWTRPISPPGAESPDAELVKLCAEFAAVEDELNRINDEIGDLTLEEREAHPLRKTDRDGADRIHELRELIAELPAKTPAGVRAKATVVLTEFRGEDDPNFPGQYDPRTAMALSLARDVLGRDAT